MSEPDPLALFRPNALPRKLNTTAGAGFRRLVGTVLGLLAGLAFAISAVIAWKHVGVTQVIWIFAAIAWAGVTGLIACWPARWGLFLGLSNIWLAVGLELHFLLIEWYFPLFWNFDFKHWPMAVFLWGAFLAKWLYVTPFTLAVRWVTDSQAEHHEMRWTSLRRWLPPLALIAFAAVAGALMPPI